MNRGQSDNVHSTIFTPQEYQVELIDACLGGNSVAVLAPRSTRSFLTTMVTRELAYQTRSSLNLRSLILGRSGKKLVKAGEAIQQNTNLAVATYTTIDKVEGCTRVNWDNVFNEGKVVVMTCEVLEGRVVSIPFHLLNLIIISDIHLLIGSDVVKEVLAKASPTTRILGMTSSLLQYFDSPSRLELFLGHLQDQSRCSVNTASEIVSILRYIYKPQERLILCAKSSQPLPSDTEVEVRRLMTDAIAFMNEHRYNLVEVYGEEYAEFCVGVPDPKIEPYSLMTDFMDILDNFGLWCADRAALYTLVEIEKMKKKTAYDRHYLLLCMVFSVMARVRAVIEECFEKYSELDQILKFSTPKVLRLIEILKEIRPKNFIDPRMRRDKNAIDEKISKDNCSLCNCRQFNRVIGISSRNTKNIIDDKIITDCLIESCEVNGIVNKSESHVLVANLSDDVRSLRIDDEISSSDEDIHNSIEINGDSIKKCVNIGGVGNLNVESISKHSSSAVYTIDSNIVRKNVITNLETVNCDGSSTDPNTVVAKNSVNIIQNGFDNDHNINDSSEKFDHSNLNGCDNDCEIIIDIERKLNGPVKDSLISTDSICEHYETSCIVTDTGSISSITNNVLDSEMINNYSSTNNTLLSNEVDGEVVESMVNKGTIVTSVNDNLHMTNGVGDKCMCRCHKNVEISEENDLNSEMEEDTPKNTVNPESHETIPTIIQNKFLELNVLADLNESPTHSDFYTPLKENHCDGKVPDDDDDFMSCDEDESVIEIEIIEDVGSSLKGSAKISLRDKSSNVSLNNGEVKSSSKLSNVSNLNGDLSNVIKSIDEEETKLDSGGIDDEKLTKIKVEDDVINGEMEKLSETDNNLKNITENNSHKQNGAGSSISIEKEINHSIELIEVDDSTNSLTNTATNELQQNDLEKGVNATQQNDLKNDVNTTKNDVQVKNVDKVLNEPPPFFETNALLFPAHARRKRRDEVKEKVKVHNTDDPDSVCGLIFVNSKTSAKIVYRLLKELSDIGGDFSWIFPQYTVQLKGENEEQTTQNDLRAIQAEHKKQEEVLRRFRHHECNLLVTTSVLESGIDIPYCNMVLRFDPATSFPSYVHCRGRAKGIETFYYHLVTEEQEKMVLRNMATFSAFENIMLKHCVSMEVGTDFEVTTEEANTFMPVYTTKTGISVRMGSSIALINKYCAKLPSDTFTRLTPMWSIETSNDKFMCTIMLPINSPLKGYTKGVWMPKSSLARMATALICCKRLHEIGELDDDLLPISKESLQLAIHLSAPLPDDNVADGVPRPGTTKRRQFYYKQVAQCQIGLEPTIELPLWVYKLDMFLTCPIPEEQNTRGRKIYRPEATVRSLGVITTMPIPLISSFPVFTRSGEVKVELVEVLSEESITRSQLELLQNFHQFTFTQVLRLEKYPIRFDPCNSKTSFYIAPLTKNETSKDVIDWDFVKLIKDFGGPKQTSPPLEEREKYVFEPKMYQDAVVMPWYRNQDQPQYFYVAEICSHLTPQSDFPDAGFESFEKYYLTKYDIQIQNLKQPLLDVDHTSGRLNLLTPRHVNRKGVALPTTSEETKKAKRENLQQKQILVPELCTLHPFPSSLWRKTVCLPTILYRINGLLLGNQLRLTVAREVNLGTLTLTKDHKWPRLDFGWSLADVLAKSKEKKEADKEKEKTETATEKKQTEDKTTTKKDEANVTEELGRRKSKSELEIGTWSNDMAWNDLEMADDTLDDEIEALGPDIELPDNLMMLEDGYFSEGGEGELGADWGTGLPERRVGKKKSKETCNGSSVRVGSPSNFERLDDEWDSYRNRKISERSVAGGVNVGGATNYSSFDEESDDDDDFENYEYEENEYNEINDKSTSEYESKLNGSRHEAKIEESVSEDDEDFEWVTKDDELSKKLEDENEKFIERKIVEIRNSPMYMDKDKELKIFKKLVKKKEDEKAKAEDAKKENEVSYVNHSDNSCKKQESETEILLDWARIEKELEEGSKDLEVITKNTKDLELVMDSVKARLIKVGNLKEPLSFSFDYQPDLSIHPGPSPSVILQALTMSNANDGMNLERLETIGDSYLKYAITTYLYCTYPQRHEGKLSYLRSKQVSNLNLYRLGKRKNFGDCMVATKFEPHDNWLPPGYFVPKELEEALIDSGVPAGHWNMADFPGLHNLDSDQIRQLVKERSEQIKQTNAEELANELISVTNPRDIPIFIPYNLLTQHSIPDKSIADCVEALIGAYLTTCGPRGALLFMSWLGIRVMPDSFDTNNINTQTNSNSDTNVGCNAVMQCDMSVPLVAYHQLEAPKSPLAFCPIENAAEELERLLSGYDEFELKIGYIFRDRSYLLQAFTHASYFKNRLTDCYQRLEFLGDAVLDYLITRHLFEDRRMHSPGALTDLRSALVNNTIFASLAVKFEFHKYFRHFSPGLDRVVRDFVRMQEENGHKVNEEYYIMEEEDECENVEDIEVPKALGDVFESVAGAIFMDSKGSLDAVWEVYYSMMKTEIELFSGVVPKSPIRELLEMEPETAKFGKPERLVDGKVRVSVEVFGKGTFSGVGRNYRIAKSTAAKRALRHLKKLHTAISQKLY